MKEASGKWEAVIGLEVHAQLMTKSKLFCRCPNQFGASPNSAVCPVCTGQPGVLPVLNQEGIVLGVRAAHALSGEVQSRSLFARKHYFYPDLPKGYQISQYEEPFCTGGYVRVSTSTGGERAVRIKRIHFEEDAGKLLHDAGGTHVDLNRAGVPLIEIVSEPDMHTAEEAGQYLRKLRNILRYIDVCDGNMEQGRFRCDANISVRRRGESTLGTKVELKNINSFRFIEKAIEHEIERQISLLDDGQKVLQQTRLWDVARGVTEVMRTKEQADDYRYFPEPDLPPLSIPVDWQASITGDMPELPDAKRDRFISDFGLSVVDAESLTGSRELATYFEAVAEVSGRPKASANWVMNELSAKLKAANKEPQETPVSSQHLGELVLLVEKGEISGKMAKIVFDEMFTSGRSPSSIIQAKGLVQINDVGQLEALAQKVVQANPQQVKAYKGGKTALLGYFVGQAMKESGGQANPSMLSAAIKKLLDS